MGAIDDLRREFEKAMQEAEAQARAQNEQARGGAKTPQLKAAPPRIEQYIQQANTRATQSGSAQPRPPAPRKMDTRAKNSPAKNTSTAETNRVDGRLVREPLNRIALTPVSKTREPTREDFRRKVEEMQRGEAEAIGALDAPEAVVPPTGNVASVTPRDLVRALIYGEVLDAPRSRRGPLDRRS